MKSHTEYLTFETREHRENINITTRVAEFLSTTGIQEGFLLVSAMHITAGVFINDNEEGFLRDLDAFLDREAPEYYDYKHNESGEMNGASHLRNIIVGHQVIVPVTRGKLDLGPWQQIFYAEFDGQRPKRLVLKVIGE